MDKNELAELIQKTTNEVLEKNSQLLADNHAIEKDIEIAIQLSCLASLKLLQKLGLIKDLDIK